ncbi:MAG: DPP IV N-terminal domain-containing protein [Ferruginibacter sp.]|nr:PD40 domain-containing protein [Chitinophagaceae bacterium]
MTRIYIALLVMIFFTSCKVTQYDHAFISNRDGDLDLYVSSSGNQLNNVTNDKFTDYGIKWSPNGKFILFAKQVNKQYDLFLYNVELKTIEQLTNDTINQFGPSFSPDGKSICFVSNLDNKLNEIYLMNLVTGKLTRITSNDRMDGSATFHPDGKRIFYTSFMDKDSLNGITNSEIFVTDTTGSYHTRLSNRPGNDGALDISPNGKKIACHYFLNGKAAIYVMDIDGNNIKQLTSDTLDNRWPRWTPDGNFLAYTRLANNNSDIWIMKANGKNKKEYVTSIKRDEILEFRPFQKSH